MKIIALTSRLLSFIFIFSNLSLIVNAKEIKKTNIKTLILDEFVRKSEYLLGPGDKLYIRFFGEPAFSGYVDILNDGTVSIPIIGDIFIQGLTVNMAEKKIEDLIKEHLIVNNIQIKIEATRNIKVAIIGEVINPGIYSLTEKERSFVRLNEVPEYRNINIVGVPTLVDAIQKSGGFKKDADLTNILIKRKAPSQKNYDDFYFANANLIKLLKEGDFKQNLFLFDGDVISISANTGSNILSPLSFGNLTSSEINIFVIGEVNNPGLVKIKANGSITKAILAAGGIKGFKANTKKIKILNEDDEGNFKIKNYNFKIKNISKKQNLSLNDGDVIIVGKKTISATLDSLGTVANPFLGFNYVIDFLKKVKTY